MEIVFFKIDQDIEIAEKKSAEIVPLLEGLTLNQINFCIHKITEEVTMRRFITKG
jgi:hypothetical protein